MSEWCNMSLVVTWQFSSPLICLLCFSAHCRFWFRLHRSISCLSQTFHFTNIQRSEDEGEKMMEVKQMRKVSGLMNWNQRTSFLLVEWRRRRLQSFPVWKRALMWISSPVVYWHEMQREISNRLSVNREPLRISIRLNKHETYATVATGTFHCFYSHGEISQLFWGDAKEMRSYVITVFVPNMMSPPHVWIRTHCTGKHMKRRQGWWNPFGVTTLLLSPPGQKPLFLKCHHSVVHTRHCKINSH